MVKIDRLRVDIAFKKNLVFSIIILVFLLQAYLHDKNIVYLFIFFIVAIVIINNIFLKKNLKNIELDLLNLQNSFAKEESILHLIVINPTSDDKFDIVVD